MRGSAILPEEDVDNFTLRRPRPLAVVDGGSVDSQLPGYDTDNQGLDHGVCGAYSETPAARNA
jgi:hypothetical protein